MLSLGNILSELSNIIITVVQFIESAIIFLPDVQNTSVSVSVNINTLIERALYIQAHYFGDFFLLI